MMAKRWSFAVGTVVLLTLLASCGQLEATLTSRPPVATPTVLASTDVPPVLTEAVFPQTPTLPSTATALPATATLAPTATLTLPPPTPTPAPILPSPTALLSEAVTPDGMMLLSVYPDGDIAVMNADGSDQRLLLDQGMPGDVFSDRLATWQPSGERISYVVDNFEQAEIWTMDSDGSDGQLLVEDVAPLTSHSWSPDGTQIAFVSSQHDVWVLDLASRTTTRLTDERLRDERDPDWSPDGSKLTFSASDGQHQDIYVMGIDGDGLKRVTSDDAQDKHPDWSPDGTRIAFSSTRRSPRFPDLYLLDLRDGTEEDGNIPIQLTFEGRLEIRPDWSPDGAWIAYLSHEPGAEHGTVYVLDVDGQVRVQVTRDNIYHTPRWRP